MTRLARPHTHERGQPHRHDEWYDYPTEPRSLLDVVQDYPHEVAEMLEQMGYDVRALMREIQQAG